MVKTGQKPEKKDQNPLKTVTKWLETVFKNGKKKQSKRSTTVKRVKKRKKIVKNSQK